MNGSDSSPTSESPPLRVACDPTITFSQRETGSQSTFVAHHPGLGKYFSFGPIEHRIARLLDGKRTVTEIVEQLEREGIDWSGTDVANFIGKLVAAHLAKPIDAGAPASPNQATIGWQQRVVMSLSTLISQRLPLFHGDSIAAAIHGRMGWLFGRTGIAIWSLWVGSGLIIVYGHSEQFAAEFRRMLNPSIWLILFGMWCVAKVLHEAGHAVAAKHHDVRVGKVGLMFFLFAPLAYVDVTDAWKLRSRWSRVQIALGGIYLELAAASVAAWIWWWLPPGPAKHLSAQFFLIAGPATLLVNANPLLRLDGYYVLADLTEIRNLRMHGRRQFRSWIERVVFEIPGEQPLLHGWRRGFATCHAACSVVFQFFWMGGLILAVSLWARGLGIVLALVAATLWGVIPFSRWLWKTWTLHPGEGWLRLNFQRRRLIALASVLAVLAQYLSLASSPFDRRVPVVVQFRDEQVARAASSAFVREVFVSAGDRIEKGALLMELGSPELKLKREEKSDDLLLAQLRAVQFRRRGELAKAASEDERAQSLQRQLSEMDQQLEGLRVVAERDGIVLGDDLENLEGRFVEEGAELLRVSDPHEKELLVSVNPRDTQAYHRAAASGQPAQIRLRGGVILQAQPASLRPRARRSLPHPALAATVGGPLMVEPSPDDPQELRTVEPVMESVTVLDPVTSAEVRAGQIGMMTIPDNRTLLSRLLDSAGD